MNNETKVGALVLAGVILFMGMVSFLGLFSLSANSYELAVKYNRASGLKKGNVVHYVGVPVGRVEKLEVEGNAVKVTVSIKKDIRIPRGSNFFLGSEGMMGGMFIDINPPAQITGEYIKPDSEVAGAYGATMESFLAAGTNVLQKLEIMADAVNTIFGDEDVQTSIKGVVINSKAITDNLSELSRVFAEVAAHNQTELENIVKQLNMMAVNMNGVAGRVNTMLRDIDNNGETGREIIASLHSMKEASANIEKITRSIQEITDNPQTKEDIRATLKNTREASEKANKILGGVGGIEAQPSIDVKYGDKPGKYRVDANLRIKPSARDFFVLGVADIGENNDFNLQYGKGNDYFGVRGGIVLGKTGAGLDIAPSGWLRFSADAYDPNDFKVRLGAELRLTERISLVGESLDVRKKAEDSAYVGIRGYF